MVNFKVVLYEGVTFVWNDFFITKRGIKNGN